MRQRTTGLWSLLEDDDDNTVVPLNINTIDDDYEKSSTEKKKTTTTAAEDSENRWDCLIMSLEIPTKTTVLSSAPPWWFRD
mmetsp:Transcript_42840/g.50102  ORF Transcript_42840/g.50102 Transcript_42840/m.50102 type:complete len:81 (+) Transcript_42840:11-253(+)